MLLIEFHGQVVGYLSAGRHNHAVGCFEVDNVHHPFECQLVEVQTVAHVVVGRHRFGVIVNHNRPITLATNGVKCLHTAPVELYRRADTVGARTKNNDRTAVVVEPNVACHARIGEVKIVGLCRIFGCERVYLLYNGQNAIRFS